MPMRAAPPGPSAMPLQRKEVPQRVLRNMQDSAPAFSAEDACKHSRGSACSLWQSLPPTSYHAHQLEQAKVHTKACNGTEACLQCAA